MIFIQASNIHCGGGAVLLTEILDSAEEHSRALTVFVDQRYNAKPYTYIKIIRIEPTLMSRFLCELRLSILSLKCPSAKFLFFGNLPPLFRTGKNSFLFFQNVLLLSDSSKKFRLKVRLKHAIEKIWLHLCIHRIRLVFVQTENVKNLFLSRFPGTSVEIKPFAPRELVERRSDYSAKKWDFLYVASADPHKNHINLIKAWVLLKETGTDCSLLLTADLSGELRALVESAQQMGCRIETRVGLSHEQTLDLYKSSRALIYPSLMESFGLPLIEAARAGLPVVASDLSYVNEIIEPQEKFDPTSAHSIAQSIVRFIKLKPLAATTKIHVADGAEFIRAIDQF